MTIKGSTSSSLGSCTPNGASACAHGPYILLIDSYDSFTFNLSTLIENVTSAKVVTIHNDSLTTKELYKILPYFDAVVVGPGPGSPDNPKDVGVLPSLWEQQDEPVPVFGVCLGFQSMVLAFGGQVKRLDTVQHGQPGVIEHTGTSIFEGIDQHFESIRYHSLHGTLSPTNSEIEPLAWTQDANENVLMAGKHKSKPFFGVQYHPESICSDKGAEVLASFWRLCQGSQKLRSVSASQDGFVAQMDEIIQKYSIKPAPFQRSRLTSSNSSSKSSTSGSESSVNYKELDLSSKLPSDIKHSEFAVHVCDFVKTMGYDFTLLNSGSEPGRWSIIGLLEPGVTKMIMHYLTYKPHVVFTRKYKAENTTETETQLCDQGIYEYLAQYMMPKLEQFGSQSIPQDCPFVGGLMGYFSYEMNDIPRSEPLPQMQDRVYADVSLVDIEKSILIDQKLGKLYVVSLGDPDQQQEFVDTTASELTHLLDKLPQLKSQKNPVPKSCQEYFESKTQFKFPDRAEYIGKIEKAKEFLRSGDSYELCLTAQTEITLPDRLDPWDLYKILLQRNPSPYSCFLDLFDSTLVGSSPERFMSWDPQGTCEFRPIKGTVKKVPGMTYEKAHAILNTNKERGENLMIVDLIRHDLNQIVSNVRVSKLMTVEEYHTVYQLVSVIQGELPQKQDGSKYLGIDLLAHSLPPGSMTGAPKIRSVEILRDLEAHPRRGVYSGVCGFWSVTDQADWSVVIRSAFQYKNESERLWRIGAGGAITILSDAADEWEEMQTKLESALQAFV